MADNRDKITEIEEVSKVSRKDGVADVDRGLVERVAPDKEGFDNLMSQDVNPGLQGLQNDEAAKASLMDDIRELQSKVGSLTQASPDTVVKQTEELITQIEQVKGKLKQPNVEIQDSVQSLLTNKLSHIDDNLKVALNRVGQEYTVPKEGVVQSNNPIERFLGFLTHGQYQLQKISQEVHQMHLNKSEISPANMLAIQIKVGYVQQEIEFFTAILNKSLESTKTIMNVQV
ncbi:MAG: hypothetical protein KDK62_05105 [Chlamydiia bacterium]|nr:hypothetical protein [Chlamydiia bacterium]